MADAKQQERRKEISSSRGSKPKPLPFLLLPVLPVLSLSLLFTLVLQTCTVHQFRMKFIELSCIHFKINSGAPVLVFTSCFIYNKMRRGLQKKKSRLHNVSPSPPLALSFCLCSITFEIVTY